MEDVKWLLRKCGLLILLLLIFVIVGGKCMKKNKRVIAHKTTELMPA